jgi:beta-lactamase regulating signal transducer with metallopeptidase domain
MMTWLGMQGIAQLSVERVLNSLPEGILIAFFAWLLLRLIGRQNSGTRFAVWFTALIAVAGLSCLAGFKLNEGRLLFANHHGPQIIVPSFWAAAIFAAWALAAFVALARIAAGLWQVWAIRRTSTEINLSQLDSAVAATFRQHSAERSVRLALSEGVRVPAAIGFWKPMIVLPSWTLQELPANELQPILIHELTHLQRRDDWTNLFQKIVRAVFFFHPAVWWIDARLSLEREMACDDAVLANTGNPRAYASSLINLLEKSCARRGWTMAQAAVQRAGELSLRIKQILDAKRPATTQVWKPALGLAGVFSLACFALSYCAPCLVSFQSNTSGSAAHIASVKALLHTDEPDMTRMPAAVIPASFHIPAPTPIEKRQAMIPKTTKRHRSTRLVAQHGQKEISPRMVMTHAFESISMKNAAPFAQMVIFVEAADFGYEQTTQVWQILLIAPAPNAAQAGVVASQI